MWVGRLLFWGRARWAGVNVSYREFIVIGITVVSFSISCFGYVTKLTDGRIFEHRVPELKSRLLLTIQSFTDSMYLTGAAYFPSPQILVSFITLSSTPPGVAHFRGELWWVIHPGICSDSTTAQAFRVYPVGRCCWTKQSWPADRMFLDSPEFLYHRPSKYVFGDYTCVIWFDIKLQRFNMHTVALYRRYPFFISDWSNQLCDPISLIIFVCFIYVHT